MELSYLIMEVLKRYSSEKKSEDTHPLNQKQILDLLQKDYPYLSDEITKKKVRMALEEMVAQESVFPDRDKLLHFHRKNGRITGYWSDNILSDLELKFLIDCVMYGNIINTRNAQNLARRIRGLSGKNLRNLTPYASGGFGKQKYSPDIDVLENVDSIIQAQAKQCKISFKLNVYSVKDSKIVLTPLERQYSVNPLEILLHNDRYYLIAAYDDSEKIYFFRIDLMTNICRLDAEKAKTREEYSELKDFRRDKFMLEHPFMYGRNVKRFHLRIGKEHLTQVVDAFGSSIQVKRVLDEEDMVEVSVRASEDAMKLWLLQYGDIAEAFNIDTEFADKMRKSIEILEEKYK